MNDQRLAKINNICLVTLTGVALTAAFIYTKTVLIPLTIALFIYAILSPILQWFQTKLGLRRPFALALTSMLFLGASTLLVFFLVSSIETFIAGAGVYRSRILEFANTSADLIAKYNLPINRDSIQETLRNIPVVSMATAFTGGAFALLGKIALVIIFVLFLISGQSVGQAAHPFSTQIQAKVARYIATKLTISLTTAILVGILLGVLKVELAFMFALLTFLLNFIPSIGSIIATLLPMPIIFLQFGFGWQFYLTFLLSGFIQFFLGNVMEPKMMGETLDLHPVTILVGLLFWGLVWGVAGMFLAVPITAIMKIVFSRIETTKPIAEIFAGRLPSSPSNVG